MTQKEFAKLKMIDWLSYPTELGKKPARIQIAKEFEYLNMKYYVFKFKANFFDNKWLIGVCGGFEDETLEDCGHTFSEFQEYNPQTDKEDSIKMVEMIRECWMNEAKKYKN